VQSVKGRFFEVSGINCSIENPSFITAVISEPPFRFSRPCTMKTTTLPIGFHSNHSLNTPGVVFESIGHTHFKIFVRISNRENIYVIEFFETEIFHLLFVYTYTTKENLAQVSN
jgi:hypothetical protein